MKISINDQEILNLSTLREKVIQNDIPQEIFEEDMKRRLKWVIEHKYEECFKRLKLEWEPRLAANGATSIPLDQDQFAALVFSQPDYRNRSLREGTPA